MEENDLERDRDLLLWWDWSINRLAERFAADGNRDRSDRSSEDDKKLSET